MAQVKLTMQSLGTEGETCSGCGTAFARGEDMAAVEYDNKEPAGWFCVSCVKAWAKGNQPGVEMPT